MAYDTTIPATGHSGSQDYLGTQGNFAQLQTSFSVNHEPLASGGGTEGFHTKVQLPGVIADPGLVSPQASLYLKTASGASQLFFQNGALAANVAQLTGNAVLTGSEYTVVTPWGLILKFGTGTAATGNNIAFAVAFPTNGFGVVITIRQNAGAGGTQSAIVTGVNGTTGFTPYYGIGGAQTLDYFAWGN